MRGEQGRKGHDTDEQRDDAADGPSLGVLIIGSLYWDNSNREKWRQKRLDLERQQYVRAPIRYGRRSTKRGCSYTMVLSAGLREPDLGTAIVVPFKSQNLSEEAKSLWKAEGGKSGEVSACWGCVGLLINPDTGLPPERHGHWREHWSKFVDGRPGYGLLAHAGDEPGAVDSAGFLTIHWPRLVDDSPLMLDALLATATFPTLVDGTRYPSAREVAEAWDTPKGKESIYFRNNLENGIETFQDECIKEHLQRLGQVC